MRENDENKRILPQNGNIELQDGVTLTTKRESILEANPDDSNTIIDSIISNSVKNDIKLNENTKVNVSEVDADADDKKYIDAMRSKNQLAILKDSNQMICMIPLTAAENILKKMGENLEEDFSTFAFGIYSLEEINEIRKSMVIDKPPKIFVNLNKDFNIIMPIIERLPRNNKPLNNILFKNVQCKIDFIKAEEERKKREEEEKRKKIEEVNRLKLLEKEKRKEKVCNKLKKIRNDNRLEILKKKFNQYRNNCEEFRIMEQRKKIETEKKVLRLKIKRDSNNPEDNQDLGEVKENDGKKKKSEEFEKEQKIFEEEKKKEEKKGKKEENKLKNEMEEEEEQLKREKKETDRLKKEAEDRLKEKEGDKLKKEEEKLRKMKEQKKKEEEEQKKKEEEEQKKKEEEEQKKKEEEVRLKKDEEDRLKKEEGKKEKKKSEEEAKSMKEEDKLKKDQEQKQVQEEERLKKEEEERKEKEEEADKKNIEEQKKKKEDKEEDKNKMKEEGILYIEKGEEKTRKGNEQKKEEDEKEKRLEEEEVNSQKEEKNKKMKEEEKGKRKEEKEEEEKRNKEKAENDKNNKEDEVKEEKKIDLNKNSEDEDEEIVKKDGIKNNNISEENQKKEVKAEKSKLKAVKKQKKVRNINDNKINVLNNDNNQKELNTNQKPINEHNEVKQKPKKKKVLKKIKKIVKIPKKKVIDNKNSFYISAAGGRSSPEDYHDNVTYTGHKSLNNFNKKNQCMNCHYYLPEIDNENNVNKKETLYVCEKCVNEIGPSQYIDNNNYNNYNGNKQLRSYYYYQNNDDNYESINAKEFFEMNRNRYLSELWEKENGDLPYGKRGVKSKSIEKMSKKGLDRNNEYDNYLKNNIKNEDKTIELRKLKRCRNKSTEAMHKPIDKNDHIENNILVNNFPNEFMINNKNNSDDLKDIKCPKCRQVYILTPEIRFYYCSNCENIMCGKCSKTHYLENPEHKCSRADFNNSEVKQFISILPNELNNSNVNDDMNNQNKNQNINLINNSNTKIPKKRNLHIKKYINKNQKKQIIIPNNTVDINDNINEENNEYNPYNNLKETNNNANSENFNNNSNNKILFGNKPNNKLIKYYNNLSYKNNYNDRFKKEKNKCDIFEEDNCFICGIKQEELPKEKFFICKECDHLLCNNCRGRHDDAHPQHNVLTSYVSGEINNQNNYKNNQLTNLEQIKSYGYINQSNNNYYNEKNKIKNNNNYLDHCERKKEYIGKDFNNKSNHYNLDYFNFEKNPKEYKGICYNNKNDLYNKDFYNPEFNNINTNVRYYINKNDDNKSQYYINKSAIDNINNLRDNNYESVINSNNSNKNHQNINNLNDKLPNNDNINFPQKKVALKRYNNNKYNNKIDTSNEEKLPKDPDNISNKKNFKNKGCDLFKNGTCLIEFDLNKKDSEFDSCQIFGNPACFNCLKSNKIENNVQIFYCSQCMKLLCRDCLYQHNNCS